MTRILAIILAIVVIAAAARQTAKATPVCVKHADVIERLHRNYSEDVTGVGVSTSGGVVELLVSDDGETWTIIITMADGKACLLVSGENWEAHSPPPGEKA